MPKKILLADDSITIQKVVELTFSDGDYEVIAVNNGARAIDKLGEMRPDIILSDIIMPERNGYEVCEYVKSQPSLRSIPVILLTGTFEPFDPDRAEKAGCDAVVTKPFESQNLIHKVEELIAAAALQAPAPEPEVEAPAPPPVDMSGETRAWQIPSMAPAYEPPQEAVSPFSRPPSFSTQEAPFELPLPEPPQTDDSPADVFETPASDAFAGETRAFPALGFDQLQSLRQPEPEPPPMFEMGAPEPPPALTPPAFNLDSATRAVPALEFDQVQTEKQLAIPEEAPAPAPLFGMDTAEPAEPPQDAATRAFPVMSFDQLQALQSSAPQGEQMFDAPADEEPLSAPSQEQVFGGAEEPAYAAETRAFPAMSFDQLQAMQQASAPEPEPVAAEPEWAAPAAEPEWAAPAAAEPEWAAPAAEEPAPSWGAPPAEEPAWGSSEPAAAPAPEPEPEPTLEPGWAAPAAEEPAQTWGEPAEQPTWGTSEPAPEPVAEPQWAAPAAEPEWAQPAEPSWDETTGKVHHIAGLDESALQAPAATPEEPAETPAWDAPAEEPAAIDEPVPAWDAPTVDGPTPEPEPVPAPMIASAAASLGVGELSQEQIDAIARRVVELMSNDIVRKIAWEVVPELADMIVRDRIKELESAD